MSAHTPERAALIELVAVKQMREEVSRRKQRRENSPYRNPKGALAVKAMHAERKVREARAWNVARAVIAKATGSEFTLVRTDELEELKRELGMGATGSAA